MVAEAGWDSVANMVRNIDRTPLAPSRGGSAYRLFHCFQVLANGNMHSPNVTPTISISTYLIYPGIYLPRSSR